MPITFTKKRGQASSDTAAFFGVSVGGGFTLPPAGRISAQDVPWLPYDVVLEVELDERRYVCTELTCGRKDGGQAVTTDGIRGVPVGRIIAEGLHDVGLPMMKAEPAGAGSTMLSPIGPWSDESVQVAAIYRLAYACGLPPTKEVAEALGVSASVASNRVMAARRAGLLDPTKRGKAGG